MNAPLAWPKSAICCLVLLPLVAAARAEAAPPIEVHFSPAGGCTETILKEVGAAKASVLVQAYWFTSHPIAQALADAHQRGVKVEVILDKSRTDKDHVQADFIVGRGVPTTIDDKHVTAHNKIIVVDGQTVLTGSFNFTGQAENQNAENLLVIRDKALAEQYTANWQAHARHSVRYAKP
jgi:phosphatidylserine/phosphatidylglycerophosphate/cardiolipin synthase-like enzyme